MRASIAVVLTASVLSTVAAAATEQRERSAARVVSMSTQRRTLSNPVARDRIRRRGMVQAKLDNRETLYFVNASLGTPPQKLRLHLDTGSSDLWVNTPSSSLCKGSDKPCNSAGTYTANSSSTYSYVGSWFNISYVDGSGAHGDYATDTIAIGDATLDSLQFGIGYTSSSAQSILGVGYELNEVQVGRAQLSPYRNLPSKLVETGLIQSSAFSLWLNDLDAHTGSILFGGVDTGQYTGSLQTIPVQQNNRHFAEFLVTLTGLQLGSSNVASDLALAVLLDSGSSLTYLPNSYVKTIYDAVGAQYDSSDGAAYVPCSLTNDKSKPMRFTFSSPVIEVGMDELVLDLFTSSGKRPTFSNGVAACLFGIAPAGSGTNVLGDTFLRSAYVVYDMANNAISLAQTRFNSTASHVVEIGIGKNSVPGATAVVNAVKATEGVSSGGILGNTFGDSGVRITLPGTVSTMVTGLAAWAIGVLLVVV